MDTLQFITDEALKYSEGDTKKLKGLSQHLYNSYNREVLFNNRELLDDTKHRSDVVVQLHTCPNEGRDRLQEIINSVLTTISRLDTLKGIIGDYYFGEVIPVVSLEPQVKTTYMVEVFCRKGGFIRS